MYPESDLAPISALQHWLFCPRQCGLIHVERLWEENRLTAEGRLLHEKAHSGAAENRPGVTIARAVPLRSLRLGLTGVADVVELVKDPTSGEKRPYPVEYKRGRPRKTPAGDDPDAVQLCAQALCLEEMLGMAIPGGSLYYGQSRKRKEVAFTPELRAKVESAALAVHGMMRTGTVPPSRLGPHCESCSLAGECMPGKLSGKIAKAYVDAIMGGSV